MPTILALNPLSVRNYHNRNTSCLLITQIIITITSSISNNNTTASRKYNVAAGTRSIIIYISGTSHHTAKFGIYGRRHCL